MDKQAAIDQLIKRYAAHYKFRPKGPFELDREYREALAEHLRPLDWAAAHEIRLGKAQADWTPDEVLRFKDAMLKRPRMRDDAIVGATLFMEIERNVPCTFAELLKVAKVSLDYLTSMRKRDTVKNIPIFANVLTMDGALLITTVHSDQRLGILRSAMRAFPVYGYALTFDAFMHAVTDKGTATKRDCFLCHIGTRDERHMIRRVYTVEGGHVDVDPDIDQDARRPAPGEEFEDPYANLFVTVPLPGRPQ